MRQNNKLSFKKFMSWLLAMTMLLSSMGISAFGAESQYSDMEGHWAKDAVQRWSSYEVINGYGDNLFQPDKAVARGEMAVIASKLLKLKDKADNTFVDVQDSDWCAEAVLQCVKAGILKGDGQTVRPWDFITREEAAVVLGRILQIEEDSNAAIQGVSGFRDSSEISTWAAGYVSSMTTKGIINGFDGKFDPKGQMSRAAVITILDNGIMQYINKAGTYTDLTSEGLILVASSGVTLQGATLKGDVILAQGVSSGTVTFDQINLEGKLFIDGKNTTLKLIKSSVLKTAVNNGEGNILDADSTSSISNVSGKTLNKPSVTATSPTTNSGSNGGSSGGGGGSVSTDVKEARAALAETVKNAKSFAASEKFLHDSEVLANEIKTSSDLSNSTNKDTINAAKESLQSLLNMLELLNTQVSLQLTENNFSLEEGNTEFVDFQTAVVNAKTLTAASTVEEIKVKAEVLSQAAAKATVKAANFEGQIVTNNWQVNEEGIQMEIALDGFTLKDNLSDEGKKSIIDSLDFSNLQFDKASQTYNEISFDDFVKTVLGAYDIDVFVIRDGINDLQRYVGIENNKQIPGVRGGIKNALKDEGQIKIENGKLIITCNNKGYFKEFTNQVSVTNGGKPMACCDLLLSATIPAELIKEGVSVSTSNKFTIQEMKTHLEVWEYVDESRKDEAGVVAITEPYEGSSATYANIYYVKRVEGDVLTEEDIRNGGTDGLLGEGSKLLKYAVDVRVGPTQWATGKGMTTFISNMFRTSKDASGYEGNSNDSYTPKDNDEWLKIENKWLTQEDYMVSSYISDNKYYINYSGNHRMDSTDPADMWMFIELPKVEDFDIDEDMTVYVNLIGGFVGGSGQSVAVNGMPALGMDGRYSFTIEAVQ